MTREEEWAIAQQHAPTQEQLAALARRDKEVMDMGIIYVPNPELFEKMIKLAQGAEPQKHLLLDET